MRKIAVFLAVILLSTLTSYAEIFESKFGFKATIPSEWLILTADELKKNPDLFSAEQESFKNTDKKFLRDIANQVRRGNCEIFLYKGTGPKQAFVDNINVFKQGGRLPQGEPACNAACANLPAAFSKTFGKSVKVYDCGSRKAAGLRALFAEFDGIIDGTRSLSYQIQWSPNFILVFTATCGNQRVNAVRRLFNDIVNSIH
jgi:hypothetical protein